MARIRTLKPEFFTSRSLARVPRDARFTFAGLWCHADDAGRGIADARVIKGAVWPLDDDITHEHVAGHLRALDGSHIRLYEVAGEEYFQIINWEKHQAASYRRGESKHPEPPSPHDSARIGVQEDAEPAHVEENPADTGDAPPLDGLHDLAREVVLEGKGGEQGEEGRGGVRAGVAPTSTRVLKIPPIIESPTHLAQLIQAVIQQELPTQPSNERRNIANDAADKLMRTLMSAADSHSALAEVEPVVRWATPHHFWSRRAINVRAIADKWPEIIADYRADQRPGRTPLTNAQQQGLANLDRFTAPLIEQRKELA